MKLKYSYIDYELDDAVFTYEGDVKKFIKDYYDEARYFGPNDCSVTECYLDGESILPKIGWDTKTGWDIAAMMAEVETRVA